MRNGAGGLLVRGDEVLLVRRSADRAIHPDVWDVPGGHREGDETPDEALDPRLAHPACAELLAKTVRRPVS